MNDVELERLLGQLGGRGGSGAANGTRFQETLQNKFDIYLLDMNFENLTIELHVLYVLNTHVKFY